MHTERAGRPHRGASDTGALCPPRGFGLTFWKHLGGTNSAKKKPLLGEAIWVPLGDPLSSWLLASAPDLNPVHPQPQGPCPRPPGLAMTQCEASPPGPQRREGLSVQSTVPWGRCLRFLLWLLSAGCPVLNCPERSTGGQ